MGKAVFLFALMHETCIYIYTYIYVLAGELTLYLAKLIASSTLVLTSPKSERRAPNLPKNTWQVAAGTVWIKSVFCTVGTKDFGRIPLGDRDQKIGASNSKHSIDSMH